MIGLSLLAAISVITFTITVYPSKKLIAAIIVIIGAITTLLYLAIKKKWGLERIFLIIAIPLGLLYTAAIPIGRVADEPSHFYRALEVSQGKFISTSSETGGGGELSVRYQEVLYQGDIAYADYPERLGVTVTDEDEKEFVNYYNTSIYFFTCYLPQAIGIFIGNLFHSPILVGAYIGRFFNFLLFILVAFFSIKKIPVLKSAIFFVSLLPMTLHQEASLSSDVMTYATAVGLFAFVIYHLYEKTKVRFAAKDYVIMCVLCVLLGMCKYAYLPLCLMVLLIPESKFGTKKKKYLSIGILAAAIVVLNILWFFLTRNMFQQREGIDAALQLKSILHNPLTFIVAISDLIFRRGRSILETTFGSSLEWLNVGIGDLVVLVMVITFCIFVYRHREAVISPELKRMAVFVFLVVTVMFIGIEYLTWTPVGSNYVDGIQGRYFLPMLFMVPLFFMKTSKKQSLQQASVPKLQKIDQSMSFAFFLLVVSVNLIAILSILIHHLTL